MAVLLLAVAACGSSSAAGAGSSTSTPTSTAAPRRASIPCGPRHARTLAVAPGARVYLLARAVDGCAAGTGRSFRLGARSRSPRQPRVGPVAVAGHDAAYALSSFEIDTATTEVLVRDLASGRVLRDVAAIHRPLPEAYQAVDAIVLRPDGAVAWIAQISSVIRRGSGGLAVVAVDAHGERLLDSGAAIVPGSLRLRGSTLTWRDGSRLRSAPLAY
jgi:hypothetical protein